MVSETPFLQLLQAKLEILEFALVEVLPALIVAVAAGLFAYLVGLFKALFSKAKPCTSFVDWTSYAMIGTLTGYLGSMSSQTLGGLVPSLIVLAAAATNASLRWSGSEASKKLDVKDTAIFASVGVVCFLISSRYFELLFN